MLRFSNGVLLTALIVGAACGCGSSGEGAAKRLPTIPVSGVVTMNGAAVEGATVTFDPGAGATDGKPAFAITDANGKYSLSTYGANDGAVAGTYFVTVTKRASAARSADPADDQDESQYNPDAPDYGQGSEGAVLIPPQYESAQTSGLKATVSDSENTFDFDLKP